MKTKLEKIVVKVKETKNSVVIVDKPLFQLQHTCWDDPVK